MSRLYDLEEEVTAQLQALKEGFAKLDGKSLDAKNEAMVSLTEKLNECKNSIKTWEREARTDGISPLNIKSRKAVFLGEFNTFLALKKSSQQEISRKAELLSGAVDTTSGEQQQESMTTQELMQYGRDKIVATDESLLRSKRVVQETVQIGTETAVKLKTQTEQMENVNQNLDDIHFNLKKATRLMRDITRQMATDKCIMFFLMIIAIGVVVIIIVKAVNPKTEGVTLPGEELRDDNVNPPTSHRRLLMRTLLGKVP
mmetsp:Transcript_4611/g.8739  ORF Transcript_4611/g.8739 Transcript_4611/m.8739 type:complete len:257 (+) Transcript_4611:361-1131(+)|eukprot:CAMPEP_0114245706 /NCGR_PEP_ID=MMETSP0058-20121206/12051_1 /TAXON_ID=36894 /ORGANISM="Pyramimonas parkeae, CCMP726" /LENGTH=256 /DNA_ID=CAMNT_0001358801 /DNA_START=322 /DNA_END=1092 /DNA_ORIENTATION=+